MSVSRGQVDVLRYAVGCGEGQDSQPPESRSEGCRSPRRLKVVRLGIEGSYGREPCVMRPELRGACTADEGSLHSYLPRFPFPFGLSKFIQPRLRGIERSGAQL